jgi:hypothetical protein
MGEESEKKPVGRPRGPTGSGVSRKIEITTADPVTVRMLEALVNYGRYGDSKQQVALHIIRTWLTENEEYLKKEIAARYEPLGEVQPEPDSSDGLLDGA